MIHRILHGHRLRGTDAGCMTCGNERVLAAFFDQRRAGF